MRGDETDSRDPHFNQWQERRFRLHLCRTLHISLLTLDRREWPEVGRWEWSSEKTLLVSLL